MCERSESRGLARRTVTRAFRRSDGWTVGRAAAEGAWVTDTGSRSSSSDRLQPLCERIRGVACPDCGRRPDVWEVDPAVQRRVKLAEDLRSLLDSSVESQDPLDVLGVMHEGVFSQIGEWLPAFLGGLSVALDSECRDRSGLTAVVRELVELRTAVAGIPPKRPMLKPRASAVRVLDQAVDMVAAYADCLGARTPIQAQVSAKLAQSHLDLMAETASGLADWVDRADDARRGLKRL